MKIYPLRHGVSFHPPLSFLSVFIKRCEKISKEGVDRGVSHLTYCVTQAAASTRDIISNPPPLILLTDTMFFVCIHYYYIVNFIIHANMYIYLDIDDFNVF